MPRIAEADIERLKKNADGVTPEMVLTGFIADLCEIMDWASEPRTDGYGSNGSDERAMARAYYERVGYPWWQK